MRRSRLMILAATRRLSVMGMALALSGCAAAMITTAPPETVTPGLHQVTVDGRAFQGEVRPGPTGLQLTTLGARPVRGQEIRVGQLRNDEGAVAKKAARATCHAAGGRFNDKAIGNFDRAGSWTFPGGCA